MDITMLRHPMVVQTVEALVADGRGLITYELGMGGRETLVAAAAALAARNGSPLTIVESPILHEDTSATVAKLQPDVQCTVISARDAALQPPPAPGSVLAVHVDLLRDPTVRVPLLVLAHATDHLLVARHDYSDPTLDSLAGPVHRLDYQTYVAATSEYFEGLAGSFDHSVGPNYVPPPTEQREGRIARQGAAERPSPEMWASAFARKWRLIDELNRRPAAAPAPDGVEYIDLDALEPAALADIDFDQLAAEVEERTAAPAEQRAAELRDRLREGAQDRAAGPQPPAPHQHDQAQSAAHQHHITGGRTPGQ
ncbi:hypothetical protein ACIQF5_21925 [Streptomyces goshikiensis]|uniref:hypothetical protein n=1 Tax=Streptomyces goshikiensis TaxID=1942 RepID=UPI0037FDDF18